MVEYRSRARQPRVLTRPERGFGPSLTGALGDAATFSRCGKVRFLARPRYYLVVYYYCCAAKIASVAIWFRAFS